MPDEEAFADTFEGLSQLVARLRGPDGCPWDREQTRASLAPKLLEECHELVEALEADSPDAVAEELGDLLLHVLLQLRIATEADEFTEADVFRALKGKLIRRHPHVFGEVVALDAREVEARWQALKRQEAPAASALGRPPRNLPALAGAQSMQSRAAHAGFDWDDLGGVLAKVAEEIAELEAAGSTEEAEAELGDVLFSVVNGARWLGIDAEGALRKANARFAARFQAMERLSRERGLSFADLPMERKEALWQEAKAAEAAGRSSLRSPG